MIRLALIGLIVFSCSSCATIFNRPSTRIDIITTSPAKVLLNDKPLVSINTRTKTQVERKVEPLLITISDESISKNITIDSRSSFAYWLNIYPTLGLGMLVDKNNPKRYTYPSRVYVDMSDSSDKYLLYDPSSRKGQLYLNFSLPHINGFLLKPDNEKDYKSNSGFWGLSTGLDYYYKESQFINFSASIVSDFFLPFPAAVDISGEYELMSSLYAALSNNHRIKRFLLGYGLNYSKNIWDLRYYNRFDPLPPTRDPIKKSNYAMGLYFSGYYQIGEYFNIGIIYRPTMFRFSSVESIEYEHLISIDFGWKIPLKK